jgi:phosphatidylinositol 4-kinase
VPLLERLSSYLPTVHAQALTPSPGLRAIEPSAYEVLTYQLSAAVLSLGIRHGLHAQATAAVASYMRGWTHAADSLSADQFDEDDRDDYPAEGELARVMMLSLSLLGFLNAAAEHAKFWNAHDRLQLVQHVRAALSSSF